MEVYFTLFVELKLHRINLIISVVNCLNYIVLQSIFKNNGTSGSSFKEGKKGTDIFKGAPVSALVFDIEIEMFLQKYLIHSRLD